MSELFLEFRGGGRVGAQKRNSKKASSESGKKLQRKKIWSGKVKFEAEIKIKVKAILSVYPIIKVTVKN